ncbi:transcriptional regulator, AsnC family [Plantibacter sp. VKM Ac-1784]|uniref:Transcriptional regulator, AsnC family n=1 Tax=Plantibacter elymi (nom. nud.) TaxID=199708 RepID=A0ABY1RGX3_9MICO|nr:Lrp/AsnC family transcriptional regulator [Plantibacter sp. VKM Ac-1784]SMQ71171.1 transcriptional regulator, AsnC family [Plantibacter sp. VKM Ac-1784]
MAKRLDGASQKILLALDAQPRATVGWLSERLRLARGTVQARMSLLFGDGVLRPTSTLVRPESLGYATRAFITAEVSQSEFERAMRALETIPEVLECHAISGETDLICHVVAVDADDLYRVGQQILRCAGIRRTSTSLILRELIPYRAAQLLQTGRSSSSVPQNEHEGKRL